MPKETVKVLMTAARTKSGLLAKSPLQYLVLSMLAWRLGAVCCLVAVGQPRLVAREAPTLVPVARLVETDNRSA